MRKIYLFLFLAMVFAGFTARSQCSTIQPLTLATSTSVTLTGSGAWSLGDCGQTTPGQEQLYQFTAPVSGTYALQVLSASGGYIDYFYKPVSAGCNTGGWTCIDDLNGLATRNFGTLTAGTQYYILADAEGTGSRTHSFSVTAVSTLTTVGNLAPYTSCLGSPSGQQSFTIEGTGLTSNINITAPPGFQVSLNANSGYAASLSLAPSSGTVTTTPIYVRLTGATAGTFSGNVSCTATGATTQDIPVSGTVNPIPDVSPISNQTLCRNSSTTAVNFTGSVPGTVYNWTNNNTATGLAASGTGNIPSFTATNSTNAPITSTVTVIPQFGATPPELLYYKFDGAGTTVPNLASNPPAGTANATINGAITQGGAGACGGSLQSTQVSTSDYVNTNWAANINGSWTISFIASGFSTANNGLITGVAGSINGSKDLTILYNPPQTPNGVGAMWVNTSLFIPADYSTTKNVTVVYDHPTLQLRGYVDGVLVATVTGNDYTVNTNGFYIGNVQSGGVGSPTAGSTIDEFRMYSRVLSLSEIQASVNSCNASGVCTGTPETFDITVYPDLVVNDPADQTICAGSATTAVNFTGTAGAVYNWTNSNPSIGLAASGTGNIPSFTPTFSGTSPITATITVTPSFSGGPSCTSSSQTFTITVNPIPDVNNVANQTVCNNAATTAINFSGTVPGTNYTWTNSNPSIGLPANGSGNIPSFTALNTTGSPITSTITVTPTFGSAVPDILYYKFDGAGTSVPNLASNPPAGTANATIGGNGSQGSSPICNGSLIGGGGFGDQVNTNWQPNYSGSFTISFKNANLSSSLSNAIFNIPSPANLRLDGYITPNNLNIMGLRGSTFPNLDIPGGVSTSSVPKTVTIVYNSATLVIDGYVDGVLAASVTALNPIDLNYTGNLRMEIGKNISSVLPAGAFLDEFRFYGRMLSLTEIQDLATSCTPGAACTGSPEIFGITVNPSPVVNPVSSQNVCTGSNTTAINFTGNVAGATYNWTNSNPSIGLAASGTGNIASFTAINTGTTTETATITVTPVDPNSSCPGTPESFTISVSPVPTGTATPASQTVCSESAISSISFTGNVPGITFDWTRDNLATVTGIPGVGNGNISGTLTNTTNAPVTVTFTVTPSLGGCVGTPFDVTVIVKESLPVATVTPVTQTICSGNITDIVPSSNYQGATYTWTRDNTTSVTGIAASGTGIISGTLFNATSSPVTVTFTITPSFNGCDGAPVTATVLVNAVPTITCPLAFSVNNDPGICGAVVNYNTTVTGAPVPTLSYSFSGATTGSGAGNGSGSVLNVGETTVTVTATNICGTATCSFRVTVVDTQNPTITCPANIQANTDAGICAGTVATPNPIRADNCAVTELTWTLTGATTGSSPATGINNVGTRLFNKGTTSVTYTVKDAAGNTATCSYTVTVRDVEIPAITCSPNITATTPAGSCTAIVNYTITATDNCPGVTTQLVSGPASGSAFPLGTTTVTWRAIDAATNVSANCSFTVTVLDGQLPVISAQPTTRTVCAGTSTTFSVTAATAPNAGGPTAYQWQQWSGLAWNNIAGATSSTYTISNPTVSMNTNTFRVVLTGLCSVVNSNAATLYVNPLPVITLSAAPYSSLVPGQQTTLTANVNPPGGNFTWFWNSSVLPGVNGSTIMPVTVEGIGTYRAVYTDPNGCVITSNDYLINGTPSENLWVYPNPNKGFFEARYYNQTGEPATIMVFNASGQLVYQRAFTTRLAYSSIVVDLTAKSYTAGVYIVKVVNNSGRELAAKKVVVYH